MIRIILILCVVYSWFGGHVAVAADSTLVPIENIPKLSESYAFIDYKDVFTEGTLFPDRVCLDTSWIKTGYSERGIVSLVPDTSVEYDGPLYRTREEQWAFLRGLLHKNNFSMHYYILANLYYHKQMSGWFKTLEWSLDGIGTICIYLHGDEEDATYSIWLISLTLTPISPDDLSYAQGPGLTLTRPGTPEVTWNIGKNRVSIRTNN